MPNEGEGHLGRTGPELHQRVGTTGVVGALGGFWEGYSQSQELVEENPRRGNREEGVVVPPLGGIRSPGLI